MTVKLNYTDVASPILEVEDRRYQLTAVFDNYLAYVGTRVIMIALKDTVTDNLGILIMQALSVPDDDFLQARDAFMTASYPGTYNAIDVFIGTMGPRAAYVTDSNGEQHALIAPEMAQVWPSEDPTGISAVNVLVPHSETPVVFHGIPMQFMGQYKDLAIMYTTSPEGARTPVSMFEMHGVVPVEEYDNYIGAFLSMSKVLECQQTEDEYGVDFQRIISTVTAAGINRVTMEEIFPRAGCEPRQTTIAIPVPVLS